MGSALVELHGMLNQLHAPFLQHRHPLPATLAWVELVAKGAGPIQTNHQLGRKFRLNRAYEHACPCAVMGETLGLKSVALRSISLCRAMCCA